MSGLHHQNVLSLIGLCMDSDVKSNSPLIVLPFMNKGDLLSYLRNEKNVSLLCFLVPLNVRYA